MMVFLMLCIAFTGINLNIAQARKMYNDIRSQVQASNGAFVDTDSNVYQFDANVAVQADGTPTGDSMRTISANGYTYRVRIVRQNLSSTVQDNNETWIYNDIYKIQFEYYYGIPLFGTQCYPIEGYTY